MIGFIKQDFVKKGEGGANQNFPHKEGGWNKSGSLNDFDLAKKRGVTFLRGVHTLVPTMFVFCVLLIYTIYLCIIFVAW